MAEGLTQDVEVYRVDATTGEEVRVGQVSFAQDGRLALLAADPDMMDRLGEAIRSVNAKEQIVELVPPEAATEKFETASRVTKRGEPDFFDALSRYMVSYYGFSLG